MFGHQEMAKGHLRAIGSNRVWCYFLVHIFKIKKVQIDFINRIARYSKVVKNFSRRDRFPVYIFQTKQTACNYLYPFSSFRTLTKSFCFFILIKNIYTCLSRLFLKFHPLMTKVSIPFFPVEMDIKSL